VSVAIGPGAMFAGYRVEALVGRGGMGVVYRATDLSLERPVALKLIVPEQAKDEHFRARFLKEPRLAAALDHPHVIPIHEAGEHDGQLYLAMRYVEGSDLKTILERDGKLEPERALKVLAQVADALDAAHRRGLVHRDVKPGNVLLDEDGHAYLTDFGITKQLSGASTDTGSVVGTLDYLAPEQIRGERVDGRTDCYALACVLYECLAGTPPFRRETEAQTLWAHMQEEPPPLAAHPSLDPVLRRALAKEPEDRYGTCAELIEAASGALGVAPPPLVRSRRLRRGALWLVAGALLLGTATVLALTQSFGDDPSTPGAPALDLATNSLGAVDAKTGKVALAAPLPGRPTDLTAGGGTAWVATVDSAAVTGVSARSRSISRTVPLSGRPDAIAVGEDSLWVADGRRGVLFRIDAGYERAVQRIRFPRAARPVRSSSDTTAPRASLAISSGAVWVTNGSQRLMRIDPRTERVTAIPAGRRLDGVAAGAGAVWAMSSRSATVVRVDPRDVAIDPVSIAARRGVDAPSPMSIAATSRAVWILNANTATVTQIDPRALGVVRTIPIGVDRVPTDIAAAGGTAWVANGDGSLSRLEVDSTAARWIEVGESLERVAVDGGRVWVTTTAVDQKLPGGAG
jgi:Protein kinase domain